MLNRTDVRRECHKITFNRGEELQQKGAVRRLNWEKKKEDGFDVVQMDADVYKRQHFRRNFQHR